MNEHQASQYGQITIQLNYDTTRTQIQCQDRYIAGLTIQEVSEFITNFPFIYHIYKKNKPNDQWKLLDQLMKVPSQSDGPGFIYGFMNENQNNILQAPYWIKMGRTKQNPPQRRIFQWQRDDNIQITQIFTVRSLYNKKLQSLVHTLFAYARKNRKINGKQRIEWFRFEQITLTAAAVNILNHIMNTLHTSHLGNKPKLYMNRYLKQITNKITLSNNQLKDIVNNQPHLIVSSFVRDFGIQLGRNDEVKLQLQKCSTLQQALQVSRQFVIGKQMNQFFDQIKIAEEYFTRYKTALAEYKQKSFQNIKGIYQKTKINLVTFSPNKAAKASKSKQHLKLNKLQVPVQKQQKTHKKKSRSKKQLKKQNEQTQKINKNKSKNKQLVKHVQNIQDYVQKLKNQQRLRRQEINKQYQILPNGDKYQQQSLTQQMERMSLQQTHKQNYSQKILETTKKVAKGTIFTKQGEVLSQQLDQVYIKKIRQNDKNLLKYKGRQKQSKAAPQYRTKSRQKSIQRSVQKKDIHNFYDLNQTKNQDQISHQIQNIKKTEWNSKEFQKSRLSQLFNQQFFGRQYYILAKQMILDMPELKLNCNIIIMTKKLIVQNHINIMKGNNGFKGYMRIFYGTGQNQNQIRLDKGCSKYAAIFKVQSNQNLIPVFQQKPKIDEASKQLGKQYLKIFHN